MNHQPEDEHLTTPSPQPEADASAPVAAAPHGNATARLAEALAGLDLASDDTTDVAVSGAESNDEALRREVPPHHV